MDKDIEALFSLKGEEFEKARKELIDREIERIGLGYPEQVARLKSKQWALDHKLDRIKNPVVRFEKMQDIFWEELEKFNNTLRQLVRENS